MAKSKYDLSDVEELLKSGKNVREIRKIKGCKSDETIYQYLRKHNLYFLQSTKGKADLTGYKWNDLTVISRNNEKKRQGSRERFWDIECHCGKVFTQTTAQITSQKSKSCGCWHTNPKFDEDRIAKKGYGRIGGCIWSKIIRDAKMRNLEVGITIEHAWGLFLKQDGECALSGLEISLLTKSKDRTEMTASLDRIDSTKGYIPGNVQWVHKRINIMKGKLTDEEFQYFCDKVSEHGKRKKD